MMLPTTAMAALFLRAGAKRVSDGAKESLKKAVVSRAEAISRQAILLARHAKRKTIKREDIELALRDL